MSEFKTKGYVHHIPKRYYARIFKTRAREGFSLSLDELCEDQGEVAVTLGEDENGQLVITGYNQLLSKNAANKKREIQDSYLCAALRNNEIQGSKADIDRLVAYQGEVAAARQYVQCLKQERAVLQQVAKNSTKCLRPKALMVQGVRQDVKSTKTYKPVARKVKPVYGTLPEAFRIERQIVGDPLKGMPELNAKTREFEPTARYTAERKQIIDKAHPGDFLWPEERKLVHNIMMDFNHTFAWEDSERGRFREDFFPPIKIPVVEHTPWVLRNIPIPPGIYEEVCGIIKKKIAAGVYEPLNSSYRSQWFCVLKKDGKSLRIVHSLEPLNKVTIAHSGLPPATEELADEFAGRACGGMFDLYVGYDERLLDSSSRDNTTFQTPYGALRLVTLPMVHMGTFNKCL